ncbi:MAG: hypothetical protein JXR10_12660 [Cyclobacteriaceae bacterium]
MRKTIAFILVCISSITLSAGQISDESISMKKVFGGYQFFQGEKRLTMNQLVEAMKSNSAAYSKITDAKSTYSVTGVLGAAGGFLIGWPLGAAIGGGKPNWSLAAVGGGLALLSIPVSKSFNKKAKDAIETYNSGLTTAAFWDKKELNLKGTTNGLSLVLKF